MCISNYSIFHKIIQSLVTMSRNTSGLRSDYTLGSRWTKLCLAADRGKSDLEINPDTPRDSCVDLHARTRRGALSDKWATREFLATIVEWTTTAARAARRQVDSFAFKLNAVREKSRTSHRSPETLGRNKSARKSAKDVEYKGSTRIIWIDLNGSGFARKSLLSVMMLSPIIHNLPFFPPFPR